jgi:hypothetical protein
MLGELAVEVEEVPNGGSTRTTAVDAYSRVCRQVRTMTIPKTRSAIPMTVHRRLMRIEGRVRLSVVPILPSIELPRVDDELRGRGIAMVINDP